MSNFQPPPNYFEREAEAVMGETFAQRCSRLETENADLCAKLEAAEKYKQDCYDTIHAICVKGLGLPDPWAEDASDEIPPEWDKQSFISDDVLKLRKERDQLREQRDALAAALEKARAIFRRDKRTESGYLILTVDIERFLESSQDPSAILAEHDRDVMRKALEGAATRLDGVGDDREPEPSVNEIAKSLRRDAARLRASHGPTMCREVGAGRCVTGNRAE